MTPRIGRTISRFHHRVSCCLSRMHLTRNMAGWWEYLYLGESIAVVGIDELNEYILRRQNTVAQYIATCTIMELCLAGKRWPGAQVSQPWWDQ